MNSVFRVEPGTRCPTCHRRVNRPRQEFSPDTKELRVKLPIERADSLNKGLDNLQEYAGIDPESYPRGTLMEYLLALGAIHREELRAYFRGAT